MDLNNISDEQLAIIVAGLVATLRKRFPKINGVEPVIGVTFVISFIACIVLVMNTGVTVINTSMLVKSAIRSIWITIQSVAGVSIVSYFAKKVNVGGLTSGNDSNSVDNNTNDDSNEVNGDKKNGTSGVKTDTIESK